MVDTASGAPANHSGSPADQARAPAAEAELLDGLTGLADLLNAGDGGLAALQHTIDLAAAATGSVGAAFIEFGEGGDRVVAAAGDLGWSVGRPIDLAQPVLQPMLAGPRVREFPVSRVDTPGTRQLAGRGIHRLMLTEAAIGATAVGLLIVGYREKDGVASPVQRSAMAFLGACVAGQYGLGRGLPVYSAGRALAPSGKAFAVLGPDRLVRSWNHAAELLTARSADDAIGVAWPFPLAIGKETVEHQMGCGRWIQIRSAPIVGTDNLAVSFRPRPDALSDSRDLFIALTGHELRTPVTVIRGYADTLVEHWDSLDDAARREGVFVVGQRARELARLVDRLLNAVSDDGVPFEGRAGIPFDVVDALRDAVAELNSDLRGALRVQLPASLPKAMGDRGSLATILTELVTNAGKYSPERVDIELTAGADAQTVWLRVSDRGVGIRPEHVERAFERFWQLEVGDQRTQGGVGLGLYLVRKIVERQHGWVSLRPRQGGGTVAEVRLSRADASTGEAG